MKNREETSYNLLQTLMSAEEIRADEFPEEVQHSGSHSCKEESVNCVHTPPNGN